MRLVTGACLARGGGSSDAPFRGEGHVVTAQVRPPAPAIALPSALVVAAGLLPIAALSAAHERQFVDANAEIDLAFVVERAPNGCLIGRQGRAQDREFTTRAGIGDSAAPDGGLAVANFTVGERQRALVGDAAPRIGAAPLDADSGKVQVGSGQNMEQAIEKGGVCVTLGSSRLDRRVAQNGPTGSSRLRETALLLSGL